MGLDQAGARAFYDRQVKYLSENDVDGLIAKFFPEKKGGPFYKK